MAPTITKKRQSTTNSALATAIGSLNDRIEKTENDFLGHLQKVEDRLDKIVELTNTVAVLQQKSSQHNEQLSEIRSEFRELAGKFETSISRIQSRLDEMGNHQRDRLDEVVAHQRERLEIFSKEIDLKVESVKSKADATDRELRQWLNRGFGGWVVGVLIFGLVQTGFYRWIDSLDKVKSETQAQVAALTKEVSKLSQQFEFYVNQKKPEYQYPDDTRLRK